MTPHNLFEFSSENLPLIVWGIYGLFITFFVIFTAILLYHWIRYAPDKRIFSTALIIYLCVSFLLIGGLTLSAWYLI